MSNVKNSKIIKKLFTIAASKGTYQYLANYLLENINKMEIISTTFIAHQTDVAQSTVSKFIKALKYDSFASFKKDLIEYRQQILLSRNENFKLKTKMLNNLEKFLNNFKNSNLNEIVQIIRKSKKIIINGAGGALRASDEFFVALKRMGYNIFMPSDFITRYATNLKSDEKSVVICISNSGKTLETILPTKIAKQNRAHIVLITTNENNLTIQTNKNHQIILNHYLPIKEIEAMQFSIIINIILITLATLI